MEGKLVDCVCVMRGEWAQGLRGFVCVYVWGGHCSGLWLYDLVGTTVRMYVGIPVVPLCPFI